MQKVRQHRIIPECEHASHKVVKVITNVLEGGWRASCTCRLQAAQMCFGVDRNKVPCTSAAMQENIQWLTCFGSSAICQFFSQAVPAFAILLLQILSKQHKRMSANSIASCTPKVLCHCPKELQLLGYMLQTSLAHAKNRCFEAFDDIVPTQGSERLATTLACQHFCSCHIVTHKPAYRAIEQHHAVTWCSQKWKTLLPSMSAP